MDTIKCSVLMCVYAGDTAERLEASLESLMSQTRTPDEIVLVQDGPLPAASLEVIDRVTSRFRGEFRRHCLETNSGLITALNEGLRLCRGELLFRMDADDAAREDRIARQEAFMDRHPEVGVLGTAMEEFIDDPALPVRVKPVKQHHDQIRRQLVWRNPVNHPTVCVRRAVLQGEGYPHLRYVEDYFLWVRLMSRGVRFHNLPETLLSYRFDDTTLQRRSGWLNFRNEIYLRWWMYRHGLATPLTFGTSVLAQAVLRFAPRAIQRRIWVRARRPLEST